MATKKPKSSVELLTRSPQDLSVTERQLACAILLTRADMLPKGDLHKIRDADELIEEATRRLAAIDRALVTLQRQGRRWSTLTPSAQKALREQTDYVRAQRTLAQLELLELVELAELPVEFMGSA
jgi:hypothetical protein